MKFNLNDEVRWTSQSAGYTVEKTGTITEVVPANTPPGVKLYKPGTTRDHESYIVRARKPNGRIGTYWPRVKHLKPKHAPSVHTEPLRGGGVQMLG